MASKNRLCEINFAKGKIYCLQLMPVTDICNEINSALCGIETEDYFLIKNGKKICDSDLVDGCLYFIPRLVGGKGGFGSMLRAIGAQIEKTTNREACRDLSGRRLRDINEEQRLKNWIAQQAEREREAAERKRKKLERLCKEPKHDFKDATYEKERSELTEKVSSSVEEGFKKASTSGISVKRTHTATSGVKKKKKKLLIDSDDDLSSSCSEIEENEPVTEVIKVDGQSNK
ncbi:splicing regulator SDE2 [Lycorma delicatula]|uniref:splicing regulator SDE2 n=1 Tax=Lycorma delicatula TaxID=130591 RepID=UPI003F511BBA